ncbi:Drought-responsive family protein [Perilla frutescens var. hirtella]|uniref:Drought-responsive family protein n=1 Tax=Perilla frutescens var. hirtella TaxID=608512 RepID=A0AAD4P9Q5_PERFH|nr:Drought-responsive family protein [Perilla frutescens var. hirtella]KAH6808648.1 Drought-responsive family protein [Perilla frutescens var. frutescens]KAH6831968.1 Drought-responsive family protein [Perilla frutescens var. hirtella]
MESDSWSRISSYSRRSRSRSDVYHGEEYEGEDEQKSEFLCPFCSEDFDVVGLCCHIDEEHAVEAKNGVCPVCAKRVGSDLIRHLTRRRRLRKGGSNFPLSIFRRELRDGNLHSLLGGSSISLSSSHTEPDPLLSSFMYNPPAADESLSVQPLSSVEECSMADNSAEDSADRVAQKCPLSDEDLREKAKRCEFVQGLLMSTFLDDL